MLFFMLESDCDTLWARKSALLSLVSACHVCVGVTLLCLVHFCLCIFVLWHAGSSTDPGSVQAVRLSAESVTLIPCFHASTLLQAAAVALGFCKQRLPNPPKRLEPLCTFRT